MDKTFIIADKETLKEVVKQAVEELLQESNHSAKENQYLTREEACKKLNTTYQSLWRWNRKGYLKPHKIGAKVYYKLSDINRLLDNGEGSHDLAKSTKSMLHGNLPP